VNQPSGLVDTGATTARDHMFACIGAVGAPSMTPPAGWTEVLSFTDETDAVTLWVYSKLADSEGASWTWTLGSSARSWGWVGAYIGVDPTDPTRWRRGGTQDSEVDSTFAVLTARTLPGWMDLISCAAVRTASGAATTWGVTSFAPDWDMGDPTERADLSTDEGSGTDITGVVGDASWTGAAKTVDAPFLLASQAQTAGVAALVGLRPYFTPYTGGIGDEGLLVEAAFGADPDGDSADYVWTDITEQLLHDARVELTAGRANGTSQADPFRMAFTLKNLTGEWTHPTGTYTTSLVKGLPFRVSVTGFGAVDAYHRGTAFLASVRPRWDQTLGYNVIDVVAAGRLRRLQQGATPLRSAAFRASLGCRPVEYWPYEDEADANSAANIVSGGVTGGTSLTFASDATFDSSDPLAVITASSVLTHPVRPATDVGRWSVIWAMKIPTEPAAVTMLIDIRATGSARQWTVVVDPANTITLNAFDSTGASLLADTAAITPATFYGDELVFVIDIVQDGANIDWTFSRADAVGGPTGTFAGTTGVPKAVNVPASTGLVGATFGHLGVYVHADLNNGDLPTDTLFTAISIYDANAGDLPGNRLIRLCEEEGVPYVALSSSVALTMGPQTTTALIDQLRECEAAEGIVLTDTGTQGDSTGLINFVGFESRDNQIVELALDLAAGHITGFDPTDDDQDTRNDVTIFRSGGSSGRYVDEEHIAREGRYVHSETLNLETDEWLRHIAAVQVARGTVPGVRFPSVEMNFRRPDARELVEGWLYCAEGSRIDIDTPPSQLPPDTIETILEGWTEILAQDTWIVRAHLSLAGSHTIAVFGADDADDDTEYVGHLDPDEMHLMVAVDSDDTAWTVHTDPPAITTADHADSFPVDLFASPAVARVAGERITLTAATAVTPAFVAAGTADHDDAATLTPGLPAGLAAGDLLLIFAASRTSGTSSPDLPAGFTRIDPFPENRNVAVFAKYATASEATPTVTFTGAVAGDTTSAQCAAFRGVSMVVKGSGAQFNSTPAQNIGYPAVGLQDDNCVVVYLGWKQDDWTSVAAISGATEIGEPDTTTGDDQGLVWDYVIQTDLANIAAGSFAVTGGSTAISRGAVIAFATGVREWTVTRSVNTLVRSHAVGAEVYLHPDDWIRMGL
jgi:hypothetical protein